MQLEGQVLAIGDAFARSVRGLLDLPYGIICRSDLQRNAMQWLQLYCAAAMDPKTEASAKKIWPGVQHGIWQGQLDAVRREVFLNLVASQLHNDTFASR